MLNPAQEDAYDLAVIDNALAGTPFAGKVRYFPSIHSTNVLAMREADEGAPEGMVYLADEQTAGRGRGAHSWHSVPGAGIYVSILLRPRVAPADILWLSLAAGLAVRQAVRQLYLARGRYPLAQRPALRQEKVLWHSHRAKR